MTKLKKAQRALSGTDESIAHWERLFNGMSEGIGSLHCALCQMFVEGGCKGCPVMAETGRHLCADSPYVAARIAYGGQGIDSPQFKEAATDEINFLKKIRRKLVNHIRALKAWQTRRLLFSKKSHHSWLTRTNG